MQFTNYAQRITQDLVTVWFRDSFVGRLWTIGSSGSTALSIFRRTAGLAWNSPASRRTRPWSWREFKWLTRGGEFARPTGFHWRKHDFSETPAGYFVSGFPVDSFPGLERQDVTFKVFQFPAT